MASPTPLRALLGGLSLPIAAHELLLLNGNVFGISGFVHSAIKGNIEGLAGAAGLVFGGFLVGKLEGTGPGRLSLSFPMVLLSGFLVGLGTKLANGCTSGHMICGISRLSLRSVVATAMFFTTGVITTQVLHRNLPFIGTIDWSVSKAGSKLLLLQVIPLTLFLFLYVMNPNQDIEKQPMHTPSPMLRALRVLAYWVTSVQFALALRLSNLSEASRVLSFLILPFHRAFDPSLALVAGGALPLGIVLYRFFRGNGKARLGGTWSIPSNKRADSKLLLGSALFGIGWGIAGLCPGPALVNLGLALGASGSSLTQYSGWFSSMILGGLFGGLRFFERM